MTIHSWEFDYLADRLRVCRLNLRVEHIKRVLVGLLTLLVLVETGRLIQTPTQKNAASTGFAAGMAIMALVATTGYQRLLQNTVTQSLQAFPPEK